MINDPDFSIYYQGFSLSDPVGNNAFSFESRQEKSIVIPRLIQGEPGDLRIGTDIVFRECVDGVERGFCGLECFVYYDSPARKRVFFFDNHQHAFFFWFAAYQSGWMPWGGSLVHVDQHKDTRHPPKPLGPMDRDQISLNEIFDYTQRVLNVGNFIMPALECGLFSKCVMVDHADAFNLEIPGLFTLDIDLDIFSPEMEYIPSLLKKRRIQEWIKQASVITVATSPYFMDQERAIDIARELFT
jgi:hypothetical protein